MKKELTALVVAIVIFGLIGATGSAAVADYVEDIGGEEAVPILVPLIIHTPIGVKRSIFSAVTKMALFCMRIPRRKMMYRTYNHCSRRSLKCTVFLWQS